MKNKLKKCKACGADVAKGAICPSCGKDNKNFFSKHKIITGILILAILTAIGGSLGGEEDAIQKSSQLPSSNESAQINDIQLEEYSTELTAGHYTAGIDFPVGTYTLTAVKGSGNVYSSNMFGGGLNEVMGKPEDDFSIGEFKNAKLEKNVVLSVSSSLILNISSDAANVSEISDRVSNVEQAIELQSGNYIAGTDFTAGTYNIVATKGSGNVSTSNMFDGGLNEIMGTAADGFSIKEFKNADLSEGVELSISGVSVRLEPSK
jgi:Ni,Fe-hydrogenase I large subunit